MLLIMILSTGQAQQYMFLIVEVPIETRIDTTDITDIIAITDTDQGSISSSPILAEAMDTITTTHMEEVIIIAITTIATIIIAIITTATVMEIVITHIAHHPGVTVLIIIAMPTQVAATLVQEEVALVRQLI